VYISISPKIVKEDNPEIEPREHYNKTLWYFYVKSDGSEFNFYRGSYPSACKITRDYNHTKSRQQVALVSSAVA